MGRLRGLILVIVMLALTVVGAIIAWSVSVTTGYLPWALVMAPIISLIIAYIVLYAFFKGETLLCAFEKALVYVRNGKIIVLPWEQIAFFQQETFENSLFGTRRRYTFRAHSGETFTVTGTPLQLDDFRRIIGNKLRPYAEQTA